MKAQEFIRTPKLKDVKQHNKSRSDLCDRDDVFDKESHILRKQQILERKFIRRFRGQIKQKDRR